MKLNVGCGLDVLDGYVNVDIKPSSKKVQFADARNLAWWHGECETVLLNHVLHLFDYDEAEQVLDECEACLTSEGVLVIVEADVLGVLGEGRGEDHVLRLVDQSVEPTDEGKLLRWATWHGTRRSMWSGVSLSQRLEARGLHSGVATWTGDRAGESFCVTAMR